MAIDTEFLKERWPLLVGGTVIGTLLVANSGDIAKNAAMNSQVKANRAASQVQIANTQFQQDAADSLAKIANERLQGICSPVVAVADPNSFAGLQKDKAPVNINTGLPLAPDTCVFDQFGLTAIVSLNDAGESVLSSFAKSDSREILNQAFEGYQGRFSNPGN